MATAKNKDVLPTTSFSPVSRGTRPIWGRVLRGATTVTTILEGRSLLDCVGRGTLEQIVHDCLRLLVTSSAVIDKHGDYALAVFDSPWCRYLHQASRDLCATADDREAMRCGRWHCHESCWNATCLKAIQSGQSVDTECRGGLRLFAVPIVVGREAVAAMALGYGNPPTQPSKLVEVSDRYAVSLEELERRAEAHQNSSEVAVQLAKQHLATSARLLGEVIEHYHRRAAPVRDELGDRGTCDLVKTVGAGPVAERGIFVKAIAATESIDHHRAGTNERRRIRVLLADDHRILRKALLNMLEEEQDLEVVGEAGDGVEAVELAGQFQPDVILMDITMPRLNGIEATRKITAAWPQVRVIGLSMHEEEGMASQMCEAGAVAYLTKGGSPDQLLATIRREPTKRGPLSL